MARINTNPPFPEQRAQTARSDAPPRRKRHPLFARFYAAVSPKMDEGGVEEHRRALVTGLTGTVIEVGAGNGLNFPHYPRSVTRVVAVEPEPYLRARASEKVFGGPVAVEITDGVAERMPFPADTFDAAVASQVLCSVNDQSAALAEIARVLRPGGVLRFFEHVRGESLPLRWVQRFLDATVWPVVAGGCHTSCDTEAAIRGAGFDIEWITRLRWPEGIPTPTSPHILGSARYAGTRA